MNHFAVKDRNYFQLKSFLGTSLTVIAKSLYLFNFVCKYIYTGKLFPVDNNLLKKIDHFHIKFQVGSEA